MKMSTERPQTFLYRISPSILREISVDLDDNLDLLEPFNKALFSPKKKKKKNRTNDPECSLGYFF